jgi:hypothetical protein
MIKKHLYYDVLYNINNNINNDMYQYLTTSVV